LLDIYHASHKFYDEFEYYCFKSCYVNVLEYYKVKNAKYYIECSLDWTFQKDQNDTFGYQFNTGDVYASFLSPFDQKIKYFSKETLSKKELWNRNKKLLEDNIPVVVATDVYYLKYTPYYHKKHSFHSLILAGYEEKNKEVYIIDWYKPWFFKGSIALEELDMARDSDNEKDGILSGNPIQYLYAQIESIDWNASTQDLINISIQDNLKKYYQGSTDSMMYKGYKAINEVAKLLECNIRLDLDKRAKFLEDLYNKFYFVVSRKKLFGWYLDEIHKDFPLIFVDEVKRQSNEAIHIWKNILSLLIKCSMLNDNATYEKVIMEMQKAIIKEKQFYYALYEFDNIMQN
jgi:hypothetical protein